MTDTIMTERIGQVDALESKVHLLLNEITKSAKAKDAGYISPDSETDRADKKSFGDFLLAVQNDNKRRLREVYGSVFREDENLRQLPEHVRTALAENAGATGGYGVPVEYGELLLEKTREFNRLRQAGATVVKMNRKSQEFPVLDIETAPTAGQTSYAGGVLGYWIEEATQITESEPRFKLLELTLHKLATYSLISNELRNDFADIDGILARALAKAVGSSEEYAFFRGDGTGKPLGILNSGCLISPQRGTASEVDLADLAQMVSDFMPDSHSKACWFISPVVYDQLIYQITAPLAWLPDLKTHWQQATLLGFPIHVVECLPDLNTAGDIILADPSYYLIGDDPAGMEISITEHYRFPYDQVTFRVTKRVDGRPMLGTYWTAEDGASTYSPFVVLAAGP